MSRYKCKSFDRLSYLIIYGAVELKYHHYEYLVCCSSNLLWAIETVITTYAEIPAIIILVWTLHIINKNSHKLLTTTTFYHRKISEHLYQYYALGRLPSAFNQCWLRTPIEPEYSQSDSACRLKQAASASDIDYQTQRGLDKTLEKAAKSSLYP